MLKRLVTCSYSKKEWLRFICVQCLSAAPDRLFHNLRALRSGKKVILCSSERRATDFEAPKLWKGRSGLSFHHLISCHKWTGENFLFSFHLFFLIFWEALLHFLASRYTGKMLRCLSEINLTLHYLSKGRMAKKEEQRAKREKSTRFLFFSRWTFQVRQIQIEKKKKTQTESAPCYFLTCLHRRNAFTPSIAFSWFILH